MELDSPPAEGALDSGNGTLRKKQRFQFQEEIDCEELSKEILTSQGVVEGELHDLFVSSPKQKTMADYVEGILELDLEDGRGQPQRRTRNLSPNLLRKRIEALREAGATNNSSFHAAEMKLKTNNNNNLRNKSSLMEEDEEGHNGVSINGEDLQKKKEELLKRISQKLDVLRAEQLSLKEEMALNEELGRQVGGIVRSHAKNNECVKYNLHVEEIDKITRLLLGLSGRLARTENSLAAIPDTDERLDERKILEKKREKLAEQLDEAKRLKENIDKRSQIVSGFLRTYLSEEQFADYDHFVKMKAKLIMDSREISDKISLGEEQIRALKESLFLSCSK